MPTFDETCSAFGADRPTTCGCEDTGCEFEPFPICREGKNQRRPDGAPKPVCGAESAGFSG
jgi:hypothetical protein